MTARLDAIVQNGYNRLEKFYTGETFAIKRNTYRVSKESEEVTENDIRSMTALPTEYLSCFISQRPKTIIEEPKKMYEEIKNIARLQSPFKGALLQNIENKVVSESSFKENIKKDTNLSLTKAPNQRIILSGLSSREIIEKVLQVTGEKITVCVKSKINVIRHAGIILKRHGLESDLV